MTPPRLARALLRAVAPRADRETLLDDLDDAFAREAGVRHPRAWYWRQVLTGLPAIVRLRLRERPVRRGSGAILRGLVIDVRYALRALARTPGFTAVAVVSLAVGIGASASLYGAIRVALLDTLAVDRAGELRLVYWAGPDTLRISQYNSGGYRDPQSQRSYRTNVSYPGLEALIAQAPDDLFGFNFVPGLTVGGDGLAASTASGLLVTGGAFPILRVPLALGRGLAPADDTAASAPVVVLTHRFWTSSLGGDPHVIGRVIRINGSAHEVVGVTAPSFAGLSTSGRFTPVADLIVPVSAYRRVWPVIDQEREARGGWERVMWLRAMTRVREDGADAGRALALASVLAGSLREGGVVTDSEAGAVQVLLRPGARGVDPMTSVAERPLRVLAGVVAVVLLIACVNLAALMLARGVARQRELAVRQALGAGRGRLIRQLLAESLVLAAIGGLAGLALAMLTRPVVEGMLATGFGADAARLPFDWSTLAAAAAVTGGAVVLFGLLPAIRTTAGGVVERLRQHMIGAAAPRQRLGRALLAVQIAISIPLIVGAILMLRTLHNLDRVDPGFAPDGLVLFRIDASHAIAQGGVATGPVEPAAVGVFARRLLDRLEAVPGVESATFMENPLLSGIMSNNEGTIDGRRVSMHMNGVGPRFFETLGIPLIAGRAPTLEDGTTADVAVVNQTAARRYFGDDRPLGRRFTFGTRELEVIGVAADTRYEGLRTAVEPTVFDPLLHRARGRRDLHVAVRTRMPGLAIEAGIRAAVAEVAPSTPVSGLRTQRAQMELLSARERLLTRLLTLFGAFALGLACVGLYGATAYAVARRTSEIGLRMALGARREQVWWMVLRSVVALTVAGLAAGIAVALAAGRLVQAFLFELSPADPLTIAAAAAIMFAVSLAAGALPARRAARIEPLIALRRD